MALTLAARGEAASKPPTPLGWTFSFNYGAGNVSMPGDTLDRKFGRSLQFSLGHIVAPGVIAGFQALTFNATAKDSLHGSSPGETTLNRNVLILAMTGTYYPRGDGLYVRGGGGVCRFRQEYVANDPNGGASTIQATEDGGFAVVGAGGWEYHFRNSLRLAVDVQYARYVANHVGGNLFSYTGGLNYYW